MATYYVELNGGDIAPKTELVGGVITPSVSFSGAQIYPTSGGGGTVTLQTKSVTYTPSTSQQTEQVTPDQGYDGLDKVNVTVDAVASGSVVVDTKTITVTSPFSFNASTGKISSHILNTVQGTATVTPGYVDSATPGDIHVYTNKDQQLDVVGATTYYPSTSDQTIATQQYLTGAQTIKGVTYSGLDAGNIKKDVVVKIGDSADDDRILSVTGTYEGGGGGGLPTAPYNDVNFYDYDGTIRYSYSKADFANLSALPENPTHPGLTAQGWNWTLADAQAFVAQYGIIDIGQSYATDDGKTRLYVTVRNTDIAPTATINFQQSVANGVTVDWGDGSATETRAGTSRAKMTHDYASDGEYVITLNPTSGTLTLVGAWNENIMGVAPTNNSYANSAILNKVEIGNNVALGDYAFLTLSLLNTITIPTSVTNLNKSQLFRSAGLKCLIVPSTVTAISGQYWLSSSCKVLSLPKTMTYATGNALPGATGLRRCIMTGEGRLENGPFNGANWTTDIIFTDEFIGNSVPINCFSNCGSLRKLTIPGTVTSIAAQAFTNCYGMREYHFKSVTPPTLANTNAFNGIKSDCKIYVPSASLTDYQTASNWSTYASYMVGE
jgi:hypothetical protein